MKQKYDLHEFVDVPTRQSVLSSLVERVRARRKERELSQKQLAIRSGVSYASVRRFETEGEISFSSLLRIAQALDCLQDFDMLFRAKMIVDLKEFQG